MSLNIDLASRHAVVTGGSKGIGRGLAEGLAVAGARVTVIARNEDTIAAAVAQMGGESAGHGGVVADLTDEASAARGIEAAVKRAGPVEIVVNNLGGTMGIRDQASGVTDWLKVWHLNAGAAITINNLVVPQMRAKGWGRLIHVTSPAADDGNASGPYVAAKAYLNAYIKTLGRELAPTGVIVSGISLGAIAAHDNVWDKRAKEAPAVVADVLAKHQAIGRLGTPSDIVPFTVLLASDSGKFAAGCILPVHGGWK